MDERARNRRVKPTVREEAWRNLEHCDWRDYCEHLCTLGMDGFQTTLTTTYITKAPTSTTLQVTPHLAHRVQRQCCTTVIRSATDSSQNFLRKTHSKRGAWHRILMNTEIEQQLKLRNPAAHACKMALLANNVSQRPVIRLASHLGKPGSITGGASRRSSYCGDLAGRCRWPAGFLGALPFPPPLHSNAAQLHTTILQLLGTSLQQAHRYQPDYQVSQQSMANLDQQIAQQARFPFPAVSEVVRLQMARWLYQAWSLLFLSNRCITEKGGFETTKLERAHSPAPSRQEKVTKEDRKGRTPASREGGCALSARGREVVAASPASQPIHAIHAIEEHAFPQHFPLSAHFTVNSLQVRPRQRNSHAISFTCLWTVDPLCSDTLVSPRSGETLEDPASKRSLQSEIQQSEKILRRERIVLLTSSLTMSSAAILYIILIRFVRGLVDLASCNQRTACWELSAGSLPNFSKWESCPDGAAGWRVFSGISLFPRRFIPVLIHTHLKHPHRLSRPRFKGHPNPFTHSLTRKVETRRPKEAAYLLVGRQHEQQEGELLQHAIADQDTRPVSRASRSQVRERVRPHHPLCKGRGGAVWSDYSPPTKANRVRFPAWWGGRFFAPKWVELVERDDSNIGLGLLREGGKTSGARLFSANRMLSVMANSRVLIKCNFVLLFGDHAAGRRVFSVIFRFPRLFNSGVIPDSSVFTLIGSHSSPVHRHRHTLQNINKKTPVFPNTFTRFPGENVGLEDANRTAAYPAEGMRSIMWRVVACEFDSSLVAPNGSSRVWLPVQKHLSFRSRLDGVDGAMFFRACTPANEPFRDENFPANKTDCSVLIGRSRTSFTYVYAGKWECAHA
ncbi:hypothetical protein PR048_003369 [Dryococelus australis]|uniref:Uncharacterized protein n=1 Tax=Dryococelus australis TaxID=614101 RepID=A0ABQ9IMX5_9NEOP|nr:hypothetical protein PR048_003369 [Dryococelus australis]